MATELRLTDREYQVLTQVAAGLSNQEIADELFLSINSLKTYIRSAYRKIGAHSRSQAVIWVLTRDLGDDGHVVAHPMPSGGS